MKKLFAFLVVVFSFLAITTSASADCVGQYGQYSQPCNSFALVVNKMVGMPGTSTDATQYTYVDNLGVFDPHFKPGQIVFFKVIVTNTSTTTLGGSTAKDFVPSYLTPLEGPGTFDPTTRTISWDAGAFDVNQSKTFYFKMQVVGQNSLPADKGIVCVVNTAQAWSNTTTDSDSSQLCIEKQVAPVTTTPSAGPEFGLILLAGNMLGAGIGLKLRKKS